MSLEYKISAEEFAEQEYAIIRKLRGERFKLKEHIENYVPKENGEHIFRILKDFFLVQAVCYEKLRKTIPEQDPSALSLQLQIATGLAGVVGERAIAGAPDLRVSFFENKKIDYQKEFPEPVTDLISLYIESMNTLAGRFSLETVTDCFFSWTTESCAANLRKEKKLEQHHLISPLYKSFFDPTIIKKKTEDSKPSIDFEKYVVSPMRESQGKELKQNNPKTSELNINESKNNRLNNGRTYTAESKREKREKNDGEKNNAKFDFIFGHDEVKEMFQELTSIIEHKEYFMSLFDEKKLFTHYLLVGPPGTGKTTLVSHLANNCNLTFVKVPCVELGSEFYSKTSRNLHEVYESARRKITEGKTNGVIIFFDEIDHIAKSRGYGMSTENDSLITTLNDHLDGGSSAPGVITIGATNVEHMIDSAILSRFKKVFVGYPQTPEELAGIHDAIIRKIETYAHKQLFEKIKYDVIMPFSDTNDSFRSGRTIERILYDTAKKKALSFLPKQEMPLITTEEIVTTYLQYKTAAEQKVYLEKTFSEIISQEKSSFVEGKKTRFA